MAKKNNVLENEKAIVNVNENNEAVVERSEVVAEMENGTTIEKNAVYKVVGGMECTILSTNTNETTLEELKTADTMLNEMDELLRTGRTATYSFFNMLRKFKEEELFKLFKNPDKPKQSFRNIQEFAKYRFGIAQTLCNNGILVSEKFFKGTEKGILINGRPAIEYGQTALIELLPVMASENDTKEDKERKDKEKEAVFAEITPFSKVKEIKESMKEHHVMKDITTRTSKDKDKDKKPTTVIDMLNAILDLFSKAYEMEDINSFTNEEKLKLDNARTEINGIVKARENA